MSFGILGVHSFLQKLIEVIGKDWKTIGAFGKMSSK